MTIFPYPRFILYLVLTLPNQLASGSDNESTYSHARIDTAGKGLLSKLLEEDHLPSSSERVECETWVSRSGRYFGTECYTKKNQDSELASLVLSSAGRARAQPAIVNSRKRRAWFQFTVDFDAKRKRYTLHQGSIRDVNAHFSGFIGPQRYAWNGLCPLATTKSKPAFVGYRVDSHGKAREIQVVPETKEKTKSAIEMCISNAHYLPAHLDDIAVESYVVEPVIRTKYAPYVET